ncbi:Piwi domain-containing protein [Rhizophagus irregularis DAOM 181602=DAOM 197198]|nr:Piwi domain-containing protein [Rhizophagus irregularis DAOM 181602=DAOM 197198]
MEIKFCFRFTLQTHGILTESLDIPNDPYVMYTNPQGKITMALNIACHKSLFNKNYLLHIIICILGSTGPIYGEIKRIGDTQLGVPTQCILLKRLARKIGIDQICSNIFLKVNAKLGGQNVILTNDQIDFVSLEPTVIFGADVFHSGRGDNRPSIAAVCVSLDSKATRYGRFSKLSFTEKNFVYRDRRFLNSLDEGLWQLRHGSW